MPIIDSLRELVSTPPTRHPATDLSRRDFCARAGAAALLASCSFADAAAQSKPEAGATPTRPDVAAIDRARILLAAQHYLGQPPTPLTALPAPASLGTARDFYSEAEPDPASDQPPPNKTARRTPAPFTAHRDALFQLGLAVPALAAAFLLTGDQRYANHAAGHLRAWFVETATSMTPRLDFAHTALPTQPPATSSHSRPGGQMEGILETLPLIEVAQAIPFLAASSALTDKDLAGLNSWFQSYLGWLTAEEDSGPRLAALARDRKDHHGTSWLLQVSAYSLLTAPDTAAPKSESAPLDQLRHRFRSTTLRAQIAYDGSFPHELSSPNPYRNSLFNLDMLAAICLLLSTRFDSVWEYELEDGVGMRSAIAYHFPFIADRTRWPFRADANHFNELPSRRASLLFCARAYQRPEYAELWTKLLPDPPSPEVLRTLPIHQPLLWVSRPQRAWRAAWPSGPSPLAVFVVRRTRVNRTVPPDSAFATQKMGPARAALPRIEPEERQHVTLPKAATIYPDRAGALTPRT